MSLIETRAALLASHGFAVFAISYLYTDHLPQNLMGADEEYIQVGLTNTPADLQTHEFSLVDSISFVNDGAYKSGILFSSLLLYM